MQAEEAEERECSRRLQNPDWLYKDYVHLDGSDEEEEGEEGSGSEEWEAYTDVIC